MTIDECVQAALAATSHVGSAHDHTTTVARAAATRAVNAEREQSRQRIAAAEREAGNLRRQLADVELECARLRGMVEEQDTAEPPVLGAPDLEER